MPDPPIEPAAIVRRSVTFLFTDIEGSTRLWDRNEAAMQRVLAHHDALAAHVIADHDGILVKRRGEGDSVFAVFEHARDALRAACAFQIAVTRADWARPLALRVRIAIHTGDAQLRDNDYFGAAVNRCARLRGIARGGQTLVSGAAQRAVGDSLPDGVSLQDLGRRRLRDLQQPEQVFLLRHRDLPDTGAPLRSLDALPNNLPTQLTSFIGREREIADVKRHLAESRLLTLTGTGGCGKTRLALQAAADLLDDYEDGIYFAELAPVFDPAGVLGTVAQALGVREEPGRALTETLAAWLRSRALLLVLDNCEHVVAVAADLADALLRACPRLRVLATSREPLHVAGEQTQRVPSLRWTAEAGNAPPEALRLFTERAALASPTFAQTPENAAAITRICEQLDGIPLAIELAAARVRVLSVEQIAVRLDDRFRLLTGGARTALPRHRTLRALFDWSYDLLSEPERALFRRASVFAGGWTLEAAEAVCADPFTKNDGIAPAAVLDLLTGLVDKSLVVVEERDENDSNEPRYRLPQVLRQYGDDRLRETPERPDVCARHAAWFLRRAEQAEPHLYGPDQAAWLPRLESNHDNFRVVLSAANLPADAETRLRLACALYPFWQIRGHFREGRGWLETARAPESEHVPDDLRARALNRAGNLALPMGDYAAARALHEESLALRRRAGDRPGIAASLGNLGSVARHEGRFDDARALHEESLAIYRALADTANVARVLTNLASAAIEQADYATARPLLEESLAILRRGGSRSVLAAVLHNLGEVAFRQHDPVTARAHLEESLRIAVDLQDRATIAYVLYDLGLIAAAEDRPVRAAGLLAAAEAARDAAEAPLPTLHREEAEQQIARLRERLGAAAFTAAWTRGHAQTPQQAAAAEAL